MTPEELKALIEGDAESHVLALKGDYIRCAARCVEIAPKNLRETMLTERGVIAAFTDPNAGEAVLQALEAASAVIPLVKRALRWLDGKGLDIGLQSVRDMLDQLQAASVLTADQVTTLKGVAEYAPVITHEQIALALDRTQAMPDTEIQAMYPELFASMYPEQEVLNNGE